MRCRAAAPKRQARCGLGADYKENLERESIGI